jgi:predicted helicase
MDGLRKCLADEFTSIYCFNLRGDARTSGEQRRKEGGNVFDAGSRTPIAITLFIKNPTKKGEFKLNYYDIGDYLTHDQKLEIVSKFENYKKVPWKRIIPNKNHDWINQRDEAFEKFLPICVKDDRGKQAVKAVFINFTQGVNTARDYWVYNFSEKVLSDGMKRMINFFELIVILLR